MQLTGFVAIGVGIVLLVFGLNAAGSPLDQVAASVTGRTSDQTPWYLSVGLASLVAGSLLAAYAPKRI